MNIPTSVHGLAVLLMFGMQMQCSAETIPLNSGKNLEYDEVVAVGPEKAVFKRSGTLFEVATWELQDDFLRPYKVPFETLRKQMLLEIARLRARLDEVERNQDKPAAPMSGAGKGDVNTAAAPSIAAAPKSNEHPSGQSTPAASANPQGLEVIPIGSIVKATTLARYYDTSSESADQVFKNKRFLFKGIVTKIEKDMSSGKLWVTFDTSGTRADVKFLMDGSVDKSKKVGTEISEFLWGDRQVRSGAEMYIEGRVRGKYRWIEISDAFPVNKSDSYQLEKGKKLSEIPEY